MKETIEHIEQLLARIESAMQLIDLEGKGHRLIQLETQMQAGGFWDDRETATRVSQQAASLKQQIEAWEHIKQQVIELLALAREDKEDLEVNLRREIDEQHDQLLAQYEELELQVLMHGGA